MNWAKRIIKSREDRKAIIIKRKRLRKRLLAASDYSEIAIVVTVFCFFVGFIVYIVFGLQAETIIDFIIASMAGLVYVISGINKRLSDTGRYIVSGTVLFLVFSLGFLISMIISLSQKNGMLARIISLLLLLISSTEEIIQYVRSQKKYIIKRNTEKDLRIESIDEKGTFDKEFDENHK